MRGARNTTAQVLELVQLMEDMLVICVECVTRDTGKPTQFCGGRPFTVAVAGKF
jgi:hypothetical protein